MRFGRTTTVVLWGAIALGSAIAAPAPAFAQDKPSKAAAAANKTQASELFKKGADAYMRGDFQASITLLDQAYALDPQPVMIYNKARAQEGLGHTDDAIALYEQYLNQDPSTPDRGAIEQRLATLKKQRDEKAALQQAQQQAQADAEKERAERAKQPPPPPPHKRSVVPYVVGGVGVAGIATGVVFGILAKGKQSDGNSAPSQVQAIDARDTGSSFATVANVAFIAGGVLLAAGAVWWALDRPRARASLPVRIAVLPGGVGGSF